mgnify:CR=1 FL=1
MWSSIQQIIKPESIHATLGLLENEGSTLFSGGTYLVGQKDRQIHTLVDINHLINSDVMTQDNDLHIGSGCTLQQLTQTEDDLLGKSILASCPSKNIRNQRTIGGEIAQARSNSDLMVYLMAASALIQKNDSLDTEMLSDWDGSGVITKLVIPKNKVQLERVSVLDSAPAFVIVGMDHSKQDVSIAIGGKTTQILVHHTQHEPDEGEIRAFLERVGGIFQNDHFGSADYKTHLVSNILMAMAVSS